MLDALRRLESRTTATANPQSRFAAFISYRHKKSSEFAENLELAIKAYAKPIWQRPMDVFRDEKYLVPGKPLDELIRAALEGSAYLIYLASPDAAASEWVTDELHQWCFEFDRLEELIIVLGEGTIAYDPVTKALDWKRTNCLPSRLEGVIEKVPLFIDARDFANPTMQKLENAEFRRAVNQIVARLRNIDPIEMSGREMLQHRRNLRLRNALFAAVAASGLAFAGPAVLAEINRRDAVAQTRQTEQRESELLASASRTARERGDYRLAMRQALEGLPRDLANPERPLVAETAGALIEAVNANRLANTVANEKDWSRATISPDSRIALYGTDDGDVVFWRRDLNPGEIARQHLQSWITAVAFSSDGNKVLATSLDGDIAILRPDGNPINLLKTGLSIESAAFDANGRLFVLGTRDGTVQVRDTVTGEIVSEFPRQTDMIATVFFTPDSQRVVAAGHDGKARLWDVVKGLKLREFSHSGWVVSAELDRSGVILATASLDGTAALWSLKDDEPIVPLAVLKHDLGVNDIRFDPTGTRVVTASRDRTARVWSVPEGRLLATFPHAQDVSEATFMPDGDHVVTGSGEEVRLWRIDSSEAVAVLGRHKERDLVSKIVIEPQGSLALMG
jgi:hypothetical protein